MGPWTWTELKFWFHSSEWGLDNGSLQDSQVKLLWRQGWKLLTSPGKTTIYFCSSPLFGYPLPLVTLLPSYATCVHLLSHSSLTSEPMAQFQDCTNPREAHHQTKEGVFPKSSITSRRGGLEWLWLGAHAFISQAVTGRSSPAPWWSCTRANPTKTGAQHTCVLLLRWLGVVLAGIMC